MTTETPCHICGQEQSNHIGAYRACPVPAEPLCLPYCECECGDAQKHHAPGWIRHAFKPANHGVECLNASKPTCECGAAIGHVCHAAECVPMCAYHAVTCPARRAAEPQGCIICGNVLTEGGEPYYWDHQPEPQGSEGSEPPIDWEAADAEARKFIQNCWDPLSIEAKQEVAPVADWLYRRAYLALKARMERYEDLIFEWSGDANERCGQSCGCGYGCPHQNGCLTECGCESKQLEAANKLADEARAIRARKGQEASR